MIGNTETTKYEFVNSEDGSIDFDKVQELMLRTMNNAMTQRDYLANAVLGLCGELGEVLALYNISDNSKYYKQYDEAQHLLKYRLELGDLCWYVMLLCKVTNINVTKIFGEADRIPCLDIDLAKDRLSSNILLLADRIKKVLYHSEVGSKHYNGVLETTVEVMDFYILLRSISAAIYYLGISHDSSLTEIFQANIDKLAKRHKGGKFSSQLQDAKLDEVQGNE